MSAKKVIGIIFGIIICLAAVGAAGYLYYKYNGDAVYKNNGLNYAQHEDVMPGVVVVGFKKEITEVDAEEIMAKTELKYVKTDQVNRGKIFDANTGPKYLVKVTAGEEDKWIGYFENIGAVYDASRYKDPENVIVD